MRAFFSSTDPTQVTCSSTTLSRFTKQFSVLLAAGIPMHEALESLSRVQSDTLAIWVAPEICKKVTYGHRLSTCLAQFPRVFPPTYVALVRASEETGKLVMVLERLSEWLERRENIERHIKKALIYPVMVIVVAFVLTMGLFRSVIPGILDTVVGLGVELPAPTKILMGVVAAIQQPISWFLFAAFLIALYTYARTPQGWERILLIATYTPAVGPVLTYSGASRYAHTMSMLIDSGVDIIRAARIASDASDHPLFKKDSIRVSDGLREGRYYGEVLSECPIYPLIMVDMIQVGDETGRMAVMLKKSGDLMEEDTMHRVDIFLNLIEPLVLSGISLGVGFIIIAVLMPMSSLVAAL